MFTSKEEIEDFFSKNKGNILTSRCIKEYFNLNEDTIQDKYPVSSCHISVIGDHLSRQVSYFSVNQILKYAFFESNMPCRAKEIFSQNKVCFGIPFGNLIFNIQGQKTTGEYIETIDSDRLAGYFKHRIPKLVQAILKAKIASSSFFFWEVSEILNLPLPFTVSPNKFFPSLYEYKNFACEMGLNVEIEQGAFSSVFDENFSGIIEENFSIKSERVLTPVSDCIDSNCFYYVDNQPDINFHLPFKRTILIPENNLGDSYKFYMNEILGLKAPGFSIMKQICSFLTDNKKSVLLEEHCWKYINSLCLETDGNLIFFEKQRVFFINQVSQLENIKYYARKIQLFSFFVCNLNKLSMELVKIRKILKKDVILEY